MPSETLHTFVPIFDWSWWQVFWFTLIIDWGIILIIKSFEPLGLKRAYWWSGLYGDIFLPIGIASSVVVLQNFNNSNAWYASSWWNWTVILIGILAIVIVETYLTLASARKYTVKQQLMPSKLWHTFIFPLMFYLSVMTLIPLFTTRTPVWAFGLALIGYGGWLATLLHDILRPPDFTRAS